MALFAVTLHGVCDNAHAKEAPVAAAEQMSAQHDADHCPCSPAEHEDSDGCHACMNCPCHTPIPNTPFKLVYSPILLDLDPADPYRALPEVYLPKFVPPQNLA